MVRNACFVKVHGPLHTVIIEPIWRGKVLRRERALRVASPAVPAAQLAKKLLEERSRGVTQ